MSEMTLFSKGGNTLPAHLRNLELDETTKALMGSGGASGKRISIKGGVFRMIVDGKEIAQNEDRAMNIVIVAANANVSRSYYEDTYVEGQVLAPTCWSNDGVSPDTKVSEPQSGKCASCPQNIAGSAESGKGRACRFSQRLAVTLENDLKGDVYQLTLPAQSIFGNVENGKMPLQAYAKFLGSHGLPVTAVVTEMRFDTASSTAKLTFKPARFLETEEFNVALEQGKSTDAIKAITMTVAQADGIKNDSEEFEQVAAPAPKKAAPVVEEDDAPEPVKRTAKKEDAPAPKKDVTKILAEWDEDE